MPGYIVSGISELISRPSDGGVMSDRFRGFEKNAHASWIDMGSVSVRWIVFSFMPTGAFPQFGPFQVPTLKNSGPRTTAFSERLAISLSIPEKMMR